MNADEKQRLVQSWITLQYAQTNAQKERNFWAHWIFLEVVQDEPDQAWELILMVLEKDISDKVVANLAAGPLEELLATHGAAIIERVEISARQRPEFRHLFGGVWQNSMPNAIWERVQRAAGRRW